MGPAITLREDSMPFNRMAYEWKTASVTVAGVTPTTDITGISGFTTLFATVPIAHHVKILVDATTYIRLNANTNDIITITSTTPFESDFVIVNKIFVATNGGASNIIIQLN